MLKRRDFENFILNENRSYLGQKVGAVLTAAQELRDDAQNMGTRDLSKFSARIADQLRSIIQGQWPRQEMKSLKRLQKIAVAIMKAIDEKGDLDSTIAAAAKELEELTADLGVPVNKFMSTPSAPPNEKEKGTSPSEQELHQKQQAQEDNTEQPAQQGQDTQVPPQDQTQMPQDPMQQM